MDICGLYFRHMVTDRKLDRCIEFFEEGLRAISVTPYHVVLGLHFLHLTDAAAQYLIDLHKAASTKILVASLYFEMNGFTINPDRWFFEGYAYRNAINNWDLDWLGNWDAESDRDLTLTGMESVQRAFADLYCVENKTLSVKLAEELTDHLVTARYMQLIAAAYKTASQQYLNLKGLSALATAHDWDIIYQSD